MGRQTSLRLHLLFTVSLRSERHVGWCVGVCMPNVRGTVFHMTCLSLRFVSPMMPDTCADMSREIILNCQFCHPEHSRPKISRQEKRVLHATRQIDTEVEEVVPQLVDRVPLPPGLFSPYVQTQFVRNLQSIVATQTQSFACSHCRRLGSDNRK